MFILIKFTFLLFLNTYPANPINQSPNRPFPVYYPQKQWQQQQQQQWQQQQQQQQQITMPTPAQPYSPYQITPSSFSQLTPSSFFQLTPKALVTPQIPTPNF